MYYDGAMGRPVPTILGKVSPPVCAHVQVTSLIQAKLESDYTMEYEVTRNWQEILLGRYQFAYDLAEVKELRTISKAEACTWLRECTHYGANYRKLTVKVSGGGGGGWSRVGGRVEWGVEWGVEWSGV